MNKMTQEEWVRLAFELFPMLDRIATDGKYVQGTVNDHCVFNVACSADWQVSQYYRNDWCIT